MSQIVKGNHIPKERESYTLDQLWLMSAFGALQTLERALKNAYDPKVTGLPVPCSVDTEMDIRQAWDNIEYDTQVVYKFLEEVQERFLKDGGL